MITSRAATVAIVGALFLHAACTPAPIRGPGQGEALSHAFTVRLHGHRYVKTKSGVDRASRTRLVSGAPVRSGAVLDLEIVLDQPAHVLLVHVRADGRAELLRTSKDEQPLAAGSHRVPVDEDAYLGFGGVAGRETFFLVASSRPLGVAAPELAQLFGAIRASPGEKAHAIRYLPPGLDAEQGATDAAGAGPALRGRGVIGRKLRGELLAGHSDDAGVAAFRVELQHVAEPPR